MHRVNVIGSYWIFLIAHLTVTFILQNSGIVAEVESGPSESSHPSSRRSLLAFAKPSKGDNLPVCLFSGKRYTIGEKWQHILDPSTANICVSCSCHQAGKVSCESNYCSDLNCDDDEPDECCQICGEDDIRASDGPTSSEGGDNYDGSEVGKEIPCYHDGRKIWDGQIFASNSTGIQTTRPNQCVQCVCQSGMVLCRLKSCLNSDCPAPIYVSDDCCPICYAEQPVRQETVQESEEDTSKGCFSAGHLYSDGEQWHPVIGPFGQMDCVLCQCQRGKTECNRLSCDDTPPCAQPRQIPGQCCPVCLGEAVEEDPVKKDILKCFPQSTDTAVYKNEVTGNVYKFAFHTAGSDVKLVTFTIKDDRTLKFSEKNVSVKDFTALTKTENFKLIGTTRSRLIQRFIKKGKRLTERCSNRCDKRTERLENALKLKQLENKDGCVIGVDF